MSEAIALPQARPLPPENMVFGVEGPAFAPAEGMGDFVQATLLESTSPLFIEEHEVVGFARIGYLWAAPEMKDRNRTIVGTAQLIRSPQKKWPSQRSFHQVRDWFGPIDYLITLSAPYCLEIATDAEFLALLDHELTHCRQDTDEWGAPRFHHDTGEPVWCVVGHDVEQFVGVTARWGGRAAGVDRLVEAANEGPRFADADIKRVVAGCGTKAQAA